MRKTVGLIATLVLMYAFVKAFSLGGAVLITGVLAFLAYVANKRRSPRSEEGFQEATQVDEEQPS